MEKTASTRWLPGFMALGIVWGSSFLFIEWGLETLTPMGVAFWRGAIGGATLLIFCLITRTRLPNRLSEWGHLAVVAFLLNSAPGFLFAYGQTQVTSVMAGLLNATTPLMVALVITFAFKEQRIDRNQGLGVIIGFIGILFVTGALSGGNQNNWRGIAALLLATFCYGIAFPYSKRFVGRLDYSSTSLAAAQVCCSTILLSPLALTSGTIHGRWNTHSIWGMLLLGALGTGFAYIWNFRTVKLAGSAIASTVTYITPVIATVLGIWLLKEPFKPLQLVGGALVLLSAALVQQRVRILSKSASN